MNIFCLFLLLAAVEGRWSGIPRPDLFNIKLEIGEKITLQPFPSLSIDRLMVKQRVNGSVKFTTLCKVQPAQIKSEVDSITLFHSENQQSRILSSLKQLKSFKNVIDLAFWKDRYYVIFSTGTVESYILSSNKSVTLFKTLTYGKQVSEGYFTYVNDILLYASRTQLLRITQNLIIPIKNYDIHEDFMYPYLYSDNTLIIACQSKGVYKYIFNSKENTLIEGVYLQLPNNIDNKIEIVDFGYDSNASLVMILDYIKGVYFYNINENKLIPNSSYSIDVSGCENMVYRNNRIYLTCPQLYMYNLRTSQLLKKQTQIYAEDLIITQNNEIILKGNSHIVFYHRWLSRPIAVELIQPNRLVYHKSQIVYINDNSLVQEVFEEYPDRLDCASEYHEVGMYQIIASSTGACGDHFETTCSYERVIDIEVWKADEINWQVVAIGGIVLAIIFVAYCLWCTVRHIRLQEATKYYNELVEEETKVESNMKLSETVE